MNIHRHLSSLGDDKERCSKSPYNSNPSCRVKPSSKYFEHTLDSPFVVFISKNSICRLNAHVQEISTTQAKMLCGQQVLIGDGATEKPHIIGLWKSRVREREYISILVGIPYT